MQLNVSVVNKIDLLEKYICHYKIILQCFRVHFKLTCQDFWHFERIPFFISLLVLRQVFGLLYYVGVVSGTCASHHREEKKKGGTKKVDIVFHDSLW